MKEMVGGCCVCSDERGWAENPLVYCDGHACSVAVHQACYGIVQVPTGPWFCRKCESQERAARVRCELCPHKDGALKRTDNGGWAHVVCALYIPEVQFANVLTMEPIVLQYVPHDRFNKTCYICEEQGRESKAASGACMTCNRHGCRQAFHVTCAQMAGLLCEEEVLEVDNVKYCGYCKYHFSKMTSRHTGRATGGGGGGGGGTVGSGSGFIPGRRSRSASPSTQQEKHPAHHEKAQKKSRKDKERLKQKHKKRPESPPSILTLPVVPTADKVSSSASSSSHHEASSQETSENSRDSKGKKSSSHSLSHKGKKLSSGKGVSSFTSTSSSSSSSSSGGPFQPAASSLQSSPDFSAFPKLEQPEEDKYSKPSAPTPSAPPSPLAPEPPKADLFEQKVVFSGFGPIIRFSTTTSSSSRARAPSPGDPKSSHASGSGPLAGTHKRMPTLSAAPAAAEEVPETLGLKEKKHKGGKRSRHGPGRPKGSRNKEGAGDPATPTLPNAQLAGFTATAASPFSGGSLVSSGLGGLASRTFGPSGSLPSLSLESPLLGAGIYTSNKDPISHGGGMLRAVCSTPLSSSLLGPRGTSALPCLRRSPFTSTLPSSSASISTTQVFSLAGSTFSLPSTHVFGTPLGTVNPLLTQAESSHTEPDLEDCSFRCRGTSPQESLSSMSPISSLPAIFDQTASGCGGSQIDPAAPGTTNMEQLLEKQSEGEAGVNIVEMLKALHALQKENQRLQEQILSLTAKKERLQILNVQLAVPFPALPAALPAANGPVPGPYGLPLQAGSSDSLSTSKSPPGKNSLGLDNSLSASSEDPHSGCPSRSSSSLSFHSTPPPLPLLQQSPATLPLALPGAPASLPPQQQNGLGQASGTAGLGAMPMADGLLGGLAGSSALPLNGLLGGLNGAATPNPAGLSQAGGAPTLQLPACLSSLTEQQRHLLQQQEQQLQQLQQLLASPQLTPEHQTVVCQMIQHIQQKRELQRLQMTGGSQLPMASLLAGSSTPLLSAGTPGLLPTASAPPLLQAGALVAPSLGNNASLMAAAAAAAAVAAAGGPPVLTAQTNPFLSLSGADGSGSVPKGGTTDKGASANQEKG
ncbi:protein AF-17 isoform X2 [Tenrec ecaudatus]|uniref:protein AF-17 isoform X2 n=1 Tax=Tenrec ecaudatus TaxID=94439 RepID=UPI003F5ACBB5